MPNCISQLILEIRRIMRLRLIYATTASGALPLLAEVLRAWRGWVNHWQRLEQSQACLDDLDLVVEMDSIRVSSGTINLDFLAVFICSHPLLLRVARTSFGLRLVRQKPAMCCPGPVQFAAAVVGRLCSQAMSRLRTCLKHRYASQLSFKKLFCLTRRKQN